MLGLVLNGVTVAQLVISMAELLETCRVAAEVVPVEQEYLAVAA
jgi:hypothetical protein